jgi:hypothetical protein
MLRPICLLATSRYSSHRYASIVEPTEPSFRERGPSSCSANRSERPIPGPSIPRNPCGDARTLNPVNRIGYQFRRADHLDLRQNCSLSFRARDRRYFRGREHAPWHIAVCWEFFRGAMHRYSQRSAAILRSATRASLAVFGTNRIRFPLRRNRGVGSLLGLYGCGCN